MKRPFHRSHIAVLIICALIMAISCKKEDCNKGEQFCRVSSETGVNIIVNSNTGQATELPFELNYKYDKHCNYLIRPLITGQKDSCVYEAGQLKEIHRLPVGSYGYNYFFNYSHDEQVVEIVSKQTNNEHLVSMDSLFYEDDILKLVRTYSNISFPDEWIKSVEREYEYYSDGNLHFVNVYYFHPVNGRYLYDVEVFKNFTEIKNPDYKSPFPELRNLSLCKTLYQNYDSNSTHGQSDYSSVTLNDCGYRKNSYSGAKIEYKCGCD